MRSIVSLLVSIVFTLPIAYANQTGSDYQRDQTTVNQNRSSVNQAAKNFNPSASLPHYDPNPSQEGYYSGVTGGDNDIKQKGAKALSNDPAGGTVYDHFKTRPRVKVNLSSPDFNDSNLVKRDSYNITHGISDQYIDCQKHKQCRTIYTDHNCTKTNTVTVNCTKTPTVNISIEPYLAPVPKPCQHIIILSNKQTPPADVSKVGGFTIRGGWLNNLAYTVYIVNGANAYQECYIPGSVHIEHDRDQHGSSSLNGLDGATYRFHAQAFYISNSGYADLYVQADGKTLSRVTANSNTGESTTLLAAVKSTHFILNGYNHGFPDDYYFGAWSVYWASTPLKQTHKVAHIIWNESCQGRGHG